MRIEYLRTGVLNVDGKKYTLTFNDDGTFQNVVNEDRRCIADPAGMLTEWEWTEGDKTKYTFLSKKEMEETFK